MAPPPAISITVGSTHDYNISITVGPTHDSIPSSFVARLTSAWNGAGAPSQTSRSVDLFMVLFVSIFLFLTAAILRLVPWASPLSPRPSWSSRTRLSHPHETDALRGYSAYAYGTLDHSTNGPFHPRPPAPAPSYETLIEIGDRIGSAKHGLTEDQISILPTYPCVENTEEDEHVRRGLYCAICRDKYRPHDQIRILPCSDEFHAECISPWLRQQATCPLCRCRFA